MPRFAGVTFSALSLAIGLAGCGSSEAPAAGQFGAELVPTERAVGPAPAGPGSADPQPADPVVVETARDTAPVDVGTHTAAARFEILTDRAAFEKAVGGEPVVVGFDDAKTSESAEAEFEPDRYRNAGVLIRGEGGQFAGRTFGYPNNYVPVSVPNTYAPGPRAARGDSIKAGGNETEVTFIDRSGKPAVVSAFGAEFVDANYPGYGKSALVAFDAEGREVARAEGFEGRAGRPVFVGVRAFDAAGRPAAMIATVRLVTGSGWPGTYANEGVTLDDLTFSTPLTAAVIVARPDAGTTVAARVQPTVAGEPRPTSVSPPPAHPAVQKEPDVPSHATSSPATASASTEPTREQPASAEPTPTDPAPRAAGKITPVRAVPLDTSGVAKFDQGFTVRLANGGKYAAATMMIGNGVPVMLLVVDLEAGKVVAGAEPNRLGGEQGWAFGPTGDTLYVGGGSETHVALDLAGGRVATRSAYDKVYREYGSKVQLPSYKSLLVSPDGRTLAAAVNVGAYKGQADDPEFLQRDFVLLDPQANPDDCRVVAKLADDFGPHWIGFSPDGSTMAAVGYGRRGPAVWDLKSRTERPTDAIGDATTNKTSDTPIAFTPDGKALVYRTAIYDLGTRKQVRALDPAAGHEAAMIGMAVSPAAPVYVTFARKDFRTKNGELLLKSLADDAVLATAVAGDGPVNAAAFSNDGKTLVTLGSDGGNDVVKVWAVAEVTQPPQRPAAAAGETADPETRAEVPAELPVPNKPADLKIGRKLEVEWRGTWYKATVLEVDGERVRIHYDGYGSSYDEWVDQSRIR